MSTPTPSVTDFGAFAGLRASARAQDPAALRKVAQQFESLMTQMLLKSARAASLSSDDVMGGGQTGFYQDMFDQQMALHLSTTGKGLGLADVLVRQMSGMPGVRAPDDAAAKAPAAGTAAFAPESVSASSPADDANAHSDFISSIRPAAERAARALGVPSHVILAQAAVETGWGRHVPKNGDGTPSYNFFGIKAGGSWDGDTVDRTTYEHLDGRMQKVSASFRSYGSVDEAFDDYVKLLQSNPQYAAALENGDTAAGFAGGLQKAGYATDPGYAGKLLEVAHGRTMSAALDSTAPSSTRWTA